MTIYFTADTHFGHGAAIRFGHRPFSSVQEMNEALVRNINACVQERDELYVLGDFSCGIPAKDAAAIRGRIRCRNVHLVAGNHDKGWGAKGAPELDGVFDVLSRVCDVKVHGRELHRLLLCHYPLPEWPGMERGVIMLHGHIHSRGPEYNELCRSQGLLRYDMGVDANGMQPVSMKKIEKWFAGVEPAPFVGWRQWAAPRTGRGEAR
jgi:calcineurin-like phosphoesterase family protein